MEDQRTATQKKEQHQQKKQQDDEKKQEDERKLEEREQQVQQDLQQKQQDEQKLQQEEQAPGPNAAEEQQDEEKAQQSREDVQQTYKAYLKLWQKYGDPWGGLYGVPGADGIREEALALWDEVKAKNDEANQYEADAEKLHAEDDSIRQAKEKPLRQEIGNDQRDINKDQQNANNAGEEVYTDGNEIKKEQVEVDNSAKEVTYAELEINNFQPQIDYTQGEITGDQNGIQAAQDDQTKMAADTEQKQSDEANAEKQLAELQQGSTPDWAVGAGLGGALSGQDSTAPNIGDPWNNPANAGQSQTPDLLGFSSEQKQILQDLLNEQWKKDMTQSLQQQDFNTWFLNKYGSYWPTGDDGKAVWPLNISVQPMTLDEIAQEKAKWAQDENNRGKEWDKEVSTDPVGNWRGQDYYLVFKYEVKGPQIKIPFKSP